MTIDEALNDPRPLVAAWDESQPKDAWLGIYAVSASSAPVLLASAAVRKEDRLARAAELKARGVRLGSRVRHGPAMWSIADDFVIWTDDGGLIEATPSQIRVGARSVTRDDVADVATFIDESRCHRGVRLDLRDGSTVIVAEEHDETPELEPTYGRDMLLFDTHWAGMLGSRLAKFLAVEYVDGI